MQKKEQEKDTSGWDLSKKRGNELKKRKPRPSGKLPTIHYTRIAHLKYLAFKIYTLH